MGRSANLLARLKGEQKTDSAMLRQHNSSVCMFYIVTPKLAIFRGYGDTDEY